MSDINRGDYWRVKNSKKYAPQVHKVPCKHCGHYNDPKYLYKRGDDKYCRCVKCGNELKTDKQAFADTLMGMLVQKEYNNEARPVIEVEDGKIVRRWSSAKKASEDLFLTRQTVMNYCNNKTKNKSYNLMWEENFKSKEE